MPLNFQTKLNLPDYSFGISHEDVIFSIGSCFAENMGQRLADTKFSIRFNPFGILYNPASIAQCFTRILNQEKYRETELVNYNDLWHSRDHHSSFSKANEQEILTLLNKGLVETHRFLTSCNRLIITLGTAFVWEEKADNKIVANCHKRPKKLFERRRLSVQEITRLLKPILQQLKELNPQLQVITSVSPVRHTNDGFIENQRSKASLILALAELEAELDFVCYFPAYELVMDDLRDYRFYGEDMLHPSHLAVDYIWEKFSASFFSPKTCSLIKKIEKIRKRVAHKAFNPNSEAHTNFESKTQDAILALQKEYPIIDFSKEIKLLS